MSLWSGSPPLESIKKYHFRSKLPQTLQKWNRNYHFRSKLGEITWISWFRIWFQNGKFIWFIIYESSLNYWNLNAYPWTLAPSKSRWNWRFWWFSHQNLKFSWENVSKSASFEIKMGENLEMEDFKMWKKYFWLRISLYYHFL